MIAALLLSASLVLVSPGDAIVITRFGNPVRVVTTSGLALKLPAPIENAITVDLRLRTTSSGLHDVGTRDGLRILVQAYIAWQIPNDAEHIQQFLRAVRNQPDIAAEQLRSFTGSALEITASSFDLANLVTEAGITGKVAEPKITNNGIDVFTERIQLIIRAPLNRLQDMVSTSWKFIGDWPVRTDGAVGGPAYFKRVVCVEHGE